MPPKSFVFNPFVLKAVIPDPYFCDRRVETNLLIDLLANGNNVVLKAERRVGKTALLHHMLADSKVSGVYDTYFVDIFSTENEKQFAETFAAALFNGNVSVPFRDRLFELASMLRIELPTDSLTGYVKPTLSLQPPLKPNYRKGIDDMFDLLEKTGRPSIVVFDEFQQVQDYPEKRLTASLRTRIQKLNNVSFVFSGSERRLLDHIFNTSTEPFYRSCTDMELRKIPKNVYVEFAGKMFTENGRSVDTSAVSDLYDLLFGYTSFLNFVLNRAYYMTRRGGHCDREIILNSLSESISSKDLDFHGLYFGFSPQSRSLLKGLAMYRGTKAITASSFLNDISLTASQSQTAAKTLMGKGLNDRHIVRDPRTGTYNVDNKFFEIWLRNFMGMSLGTQLSQASRYVVRDPRDGLRKGFPSVMVMSDQQKKDFSELGRLTEPFITETIERKKVRYLVQRSTDGKPWALPVEDCLSLMEGIESLPIKKGQSHPLSKEEKELLASGAILEFDSKRFQFDLESMIVKRRYHLKKNKLEIRR